MLLLDKYSSIYKLVGKFNQNQKYINTYIFLWKFSRCISKYPAEGVIKVFISVLYRLLQEIAPRPKLRRKLSDFPTKTVPDGVHDGKDEVEAVADVEGDEDVVEAVAHLFP